MGSKKLLWALGAALALMGVASPAALGHTPLAHRALRVPFRPHIGRLMGLVPPLGPPEVAVTPREPLVFHGGVVMHGVHVHTVFWAPAGYAFSGSPGPGVPGYEGLIQQFLGDGAHDSGSQGNAFSVLAQYGDGVGLGAYAFSYSPSSDSIDDTTPYPAAGQQCRSPGGMTACVTDLEIERELDRVIAQHDPAGRGLHDLWTIFLPPSVDTCSQAGECGTNAFGGYHSLFDLGHGVVIYAVVVDPLIEGVPPGPAPQGNPEAEVAADVVAHETVEAMTDPEGAGWMDPDGFEVGDKCDSAYGSPRGYAANGSPYNEVMNGHVYLFQSFWSNVAGGCVQSGAPAPPPALPLIALRQFSAAVHGNIGVRRSRVPVAVALIRGGVPVATGGASTRPDGSWSTTLRSLVSGAPLAVGDDRDEIGVRYGAGGPPEDVISTDGGGNPFNGAGWTGWLDLDHGFAVGSHAVAIAPCSQTGVFALSVGGRLTAPPVEQCQTETGVAVVSTPHIGLGTQVTFSTTDNRAVWPGNTAGALVRLTVAFGEPDSVSAVENPDTPLAPGGFPVCTADLRAQTASCSGLVPGARYTLTRLRGHLTRRARADQGGVAGFGAFAGSPGIAGGDLLTLRNRVHRVLTSLHVAHLRVQLRGQSRVLAGGTCEPGMYWGPTPTQPPVGTSIGNPTLGGTGTICPLDGHAAGLPSNAIEQTDGSSGGETRTEVPQLSSMSPNPGETLYGPFVALGQPALPGAHGLLYSVSGRVSLTISRRGSTRVLRRLSGLERPQGVTVTGLVPGVYTAVWTVTDAAGDTRTTQTYFVQAP